VASAECPLTRAWRAAIVFVTLSGIVGTTVQALVSHVRGQERERGRLLDDVLARIGGDEFAVLMPVCTHAQTTELVQRMRARRQRSL
jgi:GGDEF domain-containing protein